MVKTPSEVRVSMQRRRKRQLGATLIFGAAALLATQTVDANRGIVGGRGYLRPDAANREAPFESLFVSDRTPEEHLFDMDDRRLMELKKLIGILVHPGGKGKGKKSEYHGCLNKTEDELEASWIFSSQPPECEYSGGGGGGGGKGGGGGGGKGGGGGGSDDDSTTTDDHYVDDDEYTNDDIYADDDDYIDDDAYGGGDDDSYGGGNGGNSGDGTGEAGQYDGQGGNGDDDGWEPSFDVTECSTYESLWMWDLSLSCDNVTTLENCECAFAEELMSDGLLRCSDMNRCPDECPICHTCLQLVGCNRVTAVTSSYAFLYAVAGTIGICLLGTLMYYARLRQQRPVRGEVLLPGIHRLWLVPAAGDDTETELSSNDGNVWLSPVTE